MARMDCPLSSPSSPRYTPIGQRRRGSIEGEEARLMWGCSRRHPERQLPADMPDEVQSQWREWTAHHRRRLFNGAYLQRMRRPQAFGLG